jgi:hypothetical protein
MLPSPYEKQQIGVVKMQLDGETAANCAVRYGDLEKLQRLYQSGKNVNEPNPSGSKQGDTPLVTALRNRIASRDKIVMYLVEQCQVDITRLFRVADFQGGGLQRKRIYETYAQKFAENTQYRDFQYPPGTGVFSINEVAEYSGCIPLIAYIRSYSAAALRQLNYYNSLSAKPGWQNANETLVHTFQGTLDPKLIGYLKDKCMIEFVKVDSQNQSIVPHTCANIKKLTENARNIEKFLDLPLKSVDEFEAVLTELRCFTGAIECEWRKIVGLSNTVSLTCIVNSLEKAYFIQSYFLGARLAVQCQLVNVLGKHVLKFSYDDLLREAYSAGSFSNPNKFATAYTLLSNFHHVCSKLAPLAYRFDPKTSSLELFHDSTMLNFHNFNRLYNYICILCDCAEVIKIERFGFSISRLSELTTRLMKIFDTHGGYKRLEVAVDLIKMTPYAPMQKIAPYHNAIVQLHLGKNSSYLDLISSYSRGFTKNHKDEAKELHAAVNDKLFYQFLQQINSGNVPQIVNFYSHQFGSLPFLYRYNILPLRMALINFEVDVFDCVQELIVGDGPLLIEPAQLKMFFLELASGKLRIETARDIVQKIKISDILFAANLLQDYAALAILGEVHKIPDLNVINDWGMSLAFYVILGDVLRGEIDAELMNSRIGLFSEHKVDLQALCSSQVCGHECYSGMSLPFLLAKSENWVFLEYLLGCNAVSVDTVLSFEGRPGMSFVQIAFYAEEKDIMEKLIKHYHADTRGLLYSIVVAKNFEMLKFLFGKCQVELAFDILLSQFTPPEPAIKHIAAMYPANRLLKDKTPRFTLKEVADYNGYRPLIDYIQQYSSRPLSILRHLCQVAKIDKYELNTESLPHIFSVRIPGKIFEYLTGVSQLEAEVVSRKKGAVLTRLPLIKKNIDRLEKNASDIIVFFQKHYDILEAQKNSVSAALPVANQALIDAVEEMEFEQIPIVKHYPDTLYLQNLRANFLLLIRSAVGVNDWVFDNGTYTSVTLVKKDEMSVRMHNMQLLFQYITQQCAFDAEDNIILFEKIPAQVGFDWHLRLLHSTLCLPKLERLVNDNEYVKFSRRAVNTLCMLTDTLTAVDAMKNVIAGAEEKRAQAHASAIAAEKQKKDNAKAEALVADKDDKAQARSISQGGGANKNSPKGQQAAKKNKQGKGAQSKSRAAANKKQAIPQPPQPSKAKKYVRTVSSIPPQPLPTESLGKPARGGIMSGNTIVEQSYVSVPALQAPRRPAVESTPACLPAARIDDREVLQRLDQFIGDLYRVVNARKQPAYNLSTYVAAWHYLHAQMCNLLSLLGRDHLAITLFKPVAYNGRFIYDLQKHNYFPVLPFAEAASDACFQDVTAMQGALTFMIAGRYPTEACQQNTSEIVKNWAFYILNEFTRYNLVDIIKDFSANQFGLWLQKQIKHYTQEVRVLLVNDSNDRIIQYAIRFYLTRIGELVGHLPFTARSTFLKFCREFRNAAAHTFESNLDEPEFEVKKLCELLPADPRQRFFSKEATMQADWQFFVNNRYCYSQHNEEMPLVQLLAELRVRGLDAKASQRLPVVVCKPVNLKRISNLYAVIKPTLNKIIPCDEGVILLPANLLLKDAEVNPVAIALHFQLVESTLQLMGIHFSCVTNNSSGIAECMDLLKGNWLAEYKQSVKPQCTEIPQRSISADQAHHHGVLQVELLARLAEHFLLGTMTKFTADRDDSLMLNFRQEHLHLLWPTHKACYFQQMLEHGVRKQVEFSHLNNAVYTSEEPVYGLK